MDFLVNFHCAEKDASDTCQEHPKVEAHAGGIQPVVEVVERVDRSRHESREKEEVVEVSQEVPLSQRSLVTLYQPMDNAEQDVRKSHFLDGEEVLGHRVSPPVAEPRLHERVVAHGEEGNEQREGQCEQPAAFSELQKASRAVCQQCQQRQSEQGFRSNDLREYQNVAPNQQHIIDPSFPEHPLRAHEHEDEKEDGDEEWVGGEQHTNDLEHSAKIRKSATESVITVAPFKLLEIRD